MPFHCLGYAAINDPGFKRLLHEFKPRYVPPDHKTIANNYMPSLFETKKQCVSHPLNGVGNFALTTDIWTSQAKHAYSGLTVHYVDITYRYMYMYELQSHLLETREFLESHTAVSPHSG